ncbi:MAG: glycosyltransferase family 2 protein [bacterium]|nr:glycosyltransferase family 2 protein [bacterium]
MNTSPAPLVTVQRTCADADAVEPFVSFTMPAWNEQDNIERTISECRKTFEDAGIGNQPVSDSVSRAKWGEIVVTNDCSSDRTPEILAKLQESMPNLVIVTHLEKNQGYGRALSDAIAASRGAWVATIDSDGQFNPCDLPLLLKKLEDSGIDIIDCVAGYRMKKKDSGLRIFADRGLNMIVRILFGIGHRDTNCAFKLIRGKIIRSMSIETNGFQTPTEIVLKLNALKHPMVECGVTHRVRGEGKSKLKVIKTSMDFFRFLFYLRIKINLYRRKILAKL